MNTVTRLLKNTIFSAIADMGAPFISVLLVVYVSRNLGTAGLGEYSAAIAFLFFFEKLAELGLHHLIVRDIAIDKTKAGAYLTTTMVIGAASSIVSWLALYFVLGMMQYPDTMSTGIGILSLSLFFFLLTDYAISFVEGLQRLELKSIVTISEALGRVGFGVLALKLGYGVHGLLAAIVVTRLSVCILSFAMLWRLDIRPTWNFNRHLAASLLKQAMTFLLTSLISTTYWKVDMVMLSKMKDTADVGIYSAAYRLMEILKGLTYSYTSALFPILASSYALSADSLRRKCELSVRYLFMLAFPTALGATILARPIVVLIYGEAFVAAVPVLQLLIWTICLFPIALIFARALVASKNQRFDLLCNLVAMITNVGLNLALIPRYSYWGSAAATLCSIGVFTIMQYQFVTQRLFALKLTPMATKPFFAGCVMGIFTYLAREMNLFFVIAAAALIYIGALLLLKAFSNQERDMFLDVWRQKAKLVTLRG